MSANYSKLRGRIKEIYNTQNDFARALGIGKVSLSKRLNGKLDFTQSEISKSAELLKIQFESITEYFFDTKV